MIELRSVDDFHITGRGQVIVVDLRQIDGCPDRIDTADDIPLKIGDEVRIDGADYTIAGLEYATALVDPPFIKPEVGLRVWASW